MSDVSLAIVDETTEQESDIDIVEIAGRVKWFDPAKGYGFIVPDDGQPDVLLHVTCLRRDGYQVAYEGATVVCEAVRRPRGLQAFRIINMDDSEALKPHPSEARTHVVVTPTSALEQAEVKWFNRIRGYGFLTQGPGTPDIFIHMKTLRAAGARDLQPGQMVWVRYGEGPKGLMAAEIFLEEEKKSRR